MKRRRCCRGPRGRRISCALVCVVGSWGLEGGGASQLKFLGMIVFVSQSRRAAGYRSYLHLSRKIDLFWGAGLNCLVFFWKIGLIQEDFFVVHSKVVVGNGRKALLRKGLSNQWKDSLCLQGRGVGLWF